MKAPGLKLLPIWLALLLKSLCSDAALSPVNLRCEYAVDPLGVDLPAPRLFWTLQSKDRGERQTAFQVLVASSPALLARDTGELWDSGKVASDESIQIPYAGKELDSARQVFWKVRAWDAAGKPSPWSKPATWTMGLLRGQDWKAKWIGAADTNAATLLLRHDFIVRPGLRRALAFVCGLGEYELTLNGHKAGDDLFPPGWTRYDRTCLYDTRDITPLLRRGGNAVGLLLGNGMYNVAAGGRYTKFTGSFGPLKAIAQLRLEYADGSVETLGTDAQWRVRPGPITFGSVYGGEDFDARLVPAGWDQPGFLDGAWSSAQVLGGPGGELKGLSCAAPPVRAFEVLKPVKSTPLAPGVTVYDLGQNAALMARLRVRGPAGSSVRIIPAELVDDSGRISRASVGGSRTNSSWKYTLAGGASEDYAAKFFYHGSRYWQLDLFPAPGGTSLPVVESIAGVVVQGDSPAVGDFECSNALFNRIRTLVRWAQRANMMSVLTDCPHRERLGWLEQDHLNGPSLRYEFDLARLFTKQMNDIADSQTAEGLVPDIAPEYTVFKGGFRDSPEWGSACLLVPWQQYEFDGDVGLLALHYDGMKRFVAYLGGRATNDIVSHGLGDWYDLGPRPPGVAQLTPVALTATAFYYYDTWILARTAALLGKPEEARRFSGRADEIRAAFNQKFFNPATGMYATGSQTANALPLVMNLCEPARRDGVLDALVRDVRSRGNAFTAGDVGYRYLLRALAEGGRSDVIFDMNNQSDKPGYGYQLKMGATSLTEAWDARRSSSQNHFMLGQIEEWFYREVAGIGCDPAGPGFKKIIIAPQPVGNLTWARAAYNSIRGKIISDWKREPGGFLLKISIPPGTTATVSVPATAADAVTEGGQPATSRPGVTFLRMEDHRAVFATTSGDYEFRSKL